MAGTDRKGFAAWGREVWDRTWRTGLQLFLAYLSVAQWMGQVNWVAAALSAIFGMVLSALTRIVDMPSFGEAWYFQVAERAVKTFVQSLLVFIGMATAFDQVDWKMAFSSSILAAIYSTGMSTLTTRAGEVETRGNVPLVTPATSRVVQNPTVPGSTGGSGFGTVG